MSRLPQRILGLDLRLQVIFGLGVFFALVEAGLWAVVLLSGGTLSWRAIVGAVASLPFVLWLVYGSYWIGRSNLPPERYQRISARVLAGSAGLLVISITIMAVLPPENLVLVVRGIKWAALLGGGVGLLVGFLEARAIHTEFASERARLQRERFRQQNIQIQGFSNLITHDLRDPLSVAQSRLQLAKEDPETARYVEVEEALDRIELLIDELLRLVREGKPVTETEAVQLPEIAGRAWQRVNTPEAHLTVETEAAVRADPDRLRELLEKLLRNAIDHGGDDVTVSIGTFDTGFFIEDDGPGIPESDRGEVFEPGYTTADAGTGLGLAIVRQIAGAHDWDIIIAESETGGARFEITGVDTTQ